VLAQYDLARLARNLKPRIRWEGFMFRTSLLTLLFIVAATPSLADEPPPQQLSDAQITKLLVGKWEEKTRIVGMSFYTLENFKADGIIEREDIVNGGDKSISKLSWEVKDGTLITVVIQGPVAEGTVIKGKVIAIDENSLQLEMEGGAEPKKTRVKE
jgi:hypothetical protein